MTTKNRRLGQIALMMGLCLGLMGAQVVSAQTSPESVTITETGTIQASKTVPLTFGMTGTVSEVLVEEGDFVHQGDVLARLDTIDLELAIQDAQNRLNEQQIRYNQLMDPARDVDIAVAEAALNTAQANANAAYSAQPSQNEVEIARLQTEQARNQLWQAQLQRDMTLAVNPEFRNSANNSAMAQDIQINSGLTQADMGISIAETNYAAVQNEGPNLTRLGQANAGITQAQIQLDRLMDGPDATDQRLAEIALETTHLALQQAEYMLEDAVLVAPFDGLVVTSNLTVGELPPTNQPAIVLADSSAYVVDLTIDETDVVYLQVGQTVAITLEALPGTELPGTITYIGLLPAVGEAVPSYETQVTFDPGDVVVRIGMSGTAVIEAES
ncbi:efflux RND transporter periplasmic adaptor subunit [Phototrophicus methaneseepsis]|uniref:Efflux RND transporter periplasmic adaptor subunit n=1 Tax=Phototrophicus methaneseepsis TaxID=2710758 RepID=A0A7S8E6M4_9CHLR|nr:HlyD family efflux transporter periplasmic adaptor subunit [Phototrophicus methaneseepsis]QPC81304.1 efflux RND transporter periplasmic adaptor subunit [Phototrophicus methaneseepsis]